MLNPSRIIPLAFFYPIGNTPAVCLTQSLPPDQDATLLLLGCGDVRNILYTLYADLGSDTRAWDFTACDIEPEIIARNVLLLSLLLDDTDSKNVERIWNIYYHVLIDDSSLSFLRSQASKLIGIASTVDEWNQSTYGRCLRFADSESFSLAAQSWRFYAISPDSPGRTFQEQQNQLNSSACKAREIQKDVVGNDTTLSGVRSAAPCAFSALDELPTLYHNFWKDGITGPCRPPKQTKSHNLNPMFGTADTRRVLHYGTDPLLGFHLAPAYTPLSHQSPLKPSGVNSGVGNSAYRTAIEAFRAYGEALRRFASRVVIRYVCADALAFCHTLQDWQAGESRQTSSWYRSPYTFKPLILDAQEYSMQNAGAGAPIAFDVVDTSNLADHFGALNFLVAVVPLLKPLRTSTVSTELLVQREEDRERFTAGLVSGDLPTVALLFGLTPIQYWTGATSTSGFDEGILSFTRENSQITQSRFVVHWRYVSPTICSTSLSPLVFDPEELAGLLYGMYLGMFADEARQSVFEAMYNQRLDGSQAQYTRASFVAILGLIRRSNVVPWEDFMNHLSRLLVSDQTLDMGQPYREEMLMHLRTFGLWDSGGDMLGIQSRQITQAPETWSSLPSTVSLTLCIPRKRLSALKGLSHRDGTPILHIVLGDYGRDERYHIFSNVQLGFGTMKPVGVPTSENYTVQIIDEDKNGWNGESPLIASIMAPAWMLFGEDGAFREITLGLKHTTAAVSRFERKLGINLIIHRSTVGKKDVFITKSRPNMCRAATLSGMKAVDAPPKVSAPALPEDVTSHCRPDIQAQFQISLVGKDPKINNVTAHVDILPGVLQDTLRAGSAVQTTQTSATEISLSFVKDNLITALQFPFPINMAGSKTRVARKSSYIEFIAAVAPRSVLASSPDVLYPTVIQRGVPTVYNPHYIHLDRMPILNIRDPSKLEWFDAHLGSIFSARERKERDRHMAGLPVRMDARTKFKDSLFTIFAQFTGTMGADQAVSVFGLNHPDQGGIHAVIFPAHLRLDPSNQTVVMDAALLPLTTKDMPGLGPELARLTSIGIMAVKVDDEELLLWKHVLPAMAERCRRWKHSSSCEYTKAKRIPVTVELGEMVLCTCGKGKFPKGYRISLAASWKLAAKHATRVAIPLCFPVPFVEKAFDPMAELLEKPGPSGVAEKAKAALESEKGSCFNCGKAATTQAPNLRCGRCKVAEYCSKDCQRDDWKEGMHKLLCGVMQMGI